MLKRVKESWSKLKHGEPGSRFLEHYKRQQKKDQGFRRVLRVAAGIVLIPVGVFFLAVPGPGLVIIGIGAVLISQEFRWAAVALDRLEIRARRLFDSARRLWRKLVSARRQAVR